MSVGSPALRAPDAVLILARSARGSVLVYGAQVSSAAIGTAYYALLARHTARADFDAFALAILFVLPSIGYVAELGVLAAGAREIAVAPSAALEREAVGAVLLLALGLSALFSLAVAALAPVASAVYAPSAGEALLLAAPLASAIPMQQFVEAACQATGRLRLLAAFRIGSSLASLAALATVATFAQVSIAAAVWTSLGGTLVAAVAACVLLRPSFARAPTGVRSVLAIAREEGSKMYAARLAGLASARFDTLALPVLTGGVGVGLYASAQRFTQPASSFARAIATSRFRELARRDEPDPALVRANTALVATAAAALAVAGPTVYSLLFGAAYDGALRLLPPFALVALFEGLLQPYNVSLAARVRGRDLRRIAFALGALNLVGLPVATLGFGLDGAAWWAAASACAHYLLHVGVFCQRCDAR